jgi:hypothetical protein
MNDISRLQRIAAGHRSSTGRDFTYLLPRSHKALLSRCGIDSRIRSCTDLRMRVGCVDYCVTIHIYNVVAYYMKRHIFPFRRNQRGASVNYILVILSSGDSTYGQMLLYAQCLSPIISAHTPPLSVVRFNIYYTINPVHYFYVFHSNKAV